MQSNKKRIDREIRTVKAMMDIYCKINHKNKNPLCDECDELYQYALKRLDYCPFKIFKPTCAKCPIHCYSKENREKVKDIMRFSGPKMMYYHPILTIRHFIDSYFSYKAKK